MTLPSGHIPHNYGLIQWARGGCGAKAPTLAARPCRHTDRSLHEYVIAPLQAGGQSRIGWERETKEKERGRESERGRERKM